MKDITIIGTGWAAGQLTLEAVEALERAERVILHTRRCGCAGWLEEKGIAYQSLDALYDSCEDFDEHARLAAEAVMRAAEESGVVYGVADIRDRSAQTLVRRAGEAARVVAGPPVEGALLAFARGETRSVEAADWEDYHLSAHENCLVRELDSRQLAAEVKLRLMEVYPEESQILILQGGEAPKSTALFEMDRGERYDHMTCALIPAERSITRLERYDFGHLNEITATLCGENGCPWDRVQTHVSLRPNMLEEAYEVIDAIDEGDTDHLYDELGDVLMQVAIHSEIARRHGEFDILDVTTAICDKLIRRHSHIFGSDRADNPDEVLELWQRNKMAERAQRTHSEVLRDVTRALPALNRAVKVLKRSADAGLADSDAGEVADRCARRFAELTDAGKAEARLGEALMDAAGLARLMGVDPEIALNAAVNRFIDRFEALEDGVRVGGGDLDHLDKGTLRKYWDSVKL